MLEFIGFIALCFIGYKILKVFLLKKNQFNNIKNYIDVENIAINELNVPRDYFNYLISEHIQDIRELALDIKNEFPNASWPSLMALSIYIYFYDDLKMNNPIFNNIEIDINKFDDPDNVKDYFIKSKNDYVNYTNYEIENLIIKSAKIKNNKITHHPSLGKRIIKYTEDKKYFLDYFDGGMGFFAKDIDHKNDYGVFMKTTKENHKNGASPFNFNVGTMSK